MVLGLFVLISGYLMGGRPITLDRRSLTRFYGRRLLRIYPPYLLALAIYGILHLATWREIAKGAALISMLRTPTLFTLWFIAMIMAFYVVTPLLLAMANRPLRLIAVAAAGWLLFAIGWHLTGRFDVRPLLYWPAYVTGLLFAVRRPSLGIGGMVALSAAFAAALGLSAFAPRVADSSIQLAPVAWLGAPLVFLLLNGRFRENRLATRIAYASFFIYLFHRQVYVIGLALVRPFNGIEALLLLLFVLWPLVIVAGYFGQKGYDLLQRSSLNAARERTP